jgi:hypothetical protein
MVNLIHTQNKLELQKAQINIPIIAEYAHI